MRYKIKDFGAICYNCKNKAGAHYYGGTDKQFLWCPNEDGTMATKGEKGHFCDVPTVTANFKPSTGTMNNEVDNQEIIDFFFQPQSGNCKCGVIKQSCIYHKDS